MYWTVNTYTSLKMCSRIIGIYEGLKLVRIHGIVKLELQINSSVVVTSIFLTREVRLSRLDRIRGCSLFIERFELVIVLEKLIFVRMFWQIWHVKVVSLWFCTSIVLLKLVLFYFMILLVVRLRSLWSGGCVSLWASALLFTKKNVKSKL
jgi:hypothetical protein